MRCGYALIRMSLRFIMMFRFNAHVAAELAPPSGRTSVISRSRVVESHFVSVDAQRTGRAFSAEQSA